MAQELGLNEKIYFLGNINQKRLANLLTGCFAILSPLTGRSLVEGALAGLPIIAYDRDWQPDFVSGCVIGANSIVNIEIPDHSRAWGTPARIIKETDSRPT